jgi:hypothetical protein
LSTDLTIERGKKMLKRILAGTLLAGLIGVLVFGAINRTLDRTGKVAEAQGQGGYGRGRSSDQLDAGNATGQGAGQGRAAERQYPNYDVAPQAWETYEGTVVQVPEPGVELVIETSEGEELVIGTGPMDLAAQGFVLQAGEPIQVRGYWEANEFKAAQLTRLTTDQTLALRDEVGRPAWAGGGRNTQGNAQGDQTGTGQAQVDAWLEVQGNVVSADADALIVQTADGAQVAVENRPWWFAQEQGFSAQVGDQVTLTGFYEEEAFEVGRIDDTTNGQTVLIRDETGRPMWAGRGRRGA